MRLSFWTVKVMSRSVVKAQSQNTPKFRSSIRLEYSPSLDRKATYAKFVLQQPCNYKQAKTMWHTYEEFVE
jgi:hypothetical protein